MQALPPQDTIIITASRTPDADSAASATLVDAKRLERLAPPLLAEVLRLTPSLSVATSGPAGSLTEVRIRGAEANHTLLFIDGIRANDPAAGNTPRFELVNADLASRIEVVRGPQSALWGSEAIGGVVAVDGPAGGRGGSAMVEAGSFGSLRGAIRTGLGDGDRGLSLGIAGQRSDGIDSFAGRGERDGYNNLSARGSATYRVSPLFALGASGFAISGLSEYDGIDPMTYLRADTLDTTRNRLGAGRVYAILGDRSAGYAKASASLLGSSNRNLLDDALVNRTRAGRRTVALEAGYVSGKNRLIAAVESERETFAARTAPGVPFAPPDQDRSRGHQSLTLEWKVQRLGPLSTDVVVRRDLFSGFKDATSVRASALAQLAGGFQLAATYGEGIAQPTFFDLFGYYPGQFVGNPALRPESSRGGEVSLRYRHQRFGAALTTFRQQLRDEIIGIYTFPNTTANAAGRSKRQGIEAEARWALSDAVRLSAAYAWLDASEPSAPDGGQLREQRRARHSGNVAIDGAVGRVSYGAALAYNGTRTDTDFDQWPARQVRLAPYWLANARLAYDLGGGVEASLRGANLLNEHYRDVVGYRTEGRSVHAGLRLRFD